MKIKYLVIIATVGLLCCCRREMPLIPPDSTSVGTPDSLGVAGFYLLNEGNMGSNKATLDYYDYTTGIYTKNMFAATNPGVVDALGDVGNDLQIYGGRLYAVINCSNFVEVMDATTAKHIGEISLPNCRYITFANGRAYVSSYAGTVELGNTQLGYVAEVDTATLAVLRTVTVGYQPEEMAVVDGKLYVANSGGYTPGHYDHTISIVDLETFSEVGKIEVPLNPHRLKADQRGNLYVSSRGDYFEVSSNLSVVDTRTNSVVHTFDVACGNFCIAGDSAYVFSYEYNKNSGAITTTYALIDIAERKVVGTRFLADDVAEAIKVPYGLAVNPLTREIIITDAKNYLVPGMLYYCRPDGTLLWSVTTGDIPSRIAFRIQSK